MRVIITGGTGLIGRAFAALMVKDGHETIVLSRSPEANRDRVPAGVAVRGWDGSSGAGWHRLITTDTAIVNLAGENPAHWRWTQAHKRRVLESRVRSVQAIQNAIEIEQRAPKTLLQASAVGFYGHRGDAVITESSFSGEGFRADVTKIWERYAQDIAARQVYLRIGIVLSPQSGALPPFVAAAKLFGARLGRGTQWIPWIHLYDTASAMRFLLYRAESHGAYNLTAPTPTTNAEFMAMLTQVLGRAPLLPVPERALKLALGEMADTVLESQRVLPERLLQEGFEFRYHTLEPALRDLLRA